MKKDWDKLRRSSVTEKPNVVAPEIQGLAEQLDQKSRDVRIQASAFLLTIARFRPDSAVILLPAVSALVNHVRDPVSQTRQNCVNALAFMKPQMPVSALPLLLSLVDGQDVAVQPGAIFGVARMANTSAEAARMLNQLLSQSNSATKKKLVLEAIPAAGVSDRQLVARLGVFLSDRDKEIQRTALLAINKFGNEAVILNRNQLAIFAQTSTDKDLAGLAQQLLNQ